MANNLVYSWADNLWQMNPPRNHMPARWRALETAKHLKIKFRIK